MSAVCNSIRIHCFVYFIRMFRVFISCNMREYLFKAGQNSQNKNNYRIFLSKKKIDGPLNFLNEVSAAATAGEFF